MGFWNTLLKYGGKAAKGAGHAAVATGRSAGQAVLHPSQTLRGAGQAMKTAAVGGAAGYVAWEKLTTDKSVARIVGDAVIGESATDALAGSTEGIRELKGKAGEAVDAVSGAAESIGSSLNGVSNFMGQATGGPVPGHDAHRQQRRSCPHGSPGNRPQRLRSGSFRRGGAGTGRRHEKIGHKYRQRNEIYRRNDTSLRQRLLYAVRGT